MRGAIDDGVEDFGRHAVEEERESDESGHDERDEEPSIRRPSIEYKLANDQRDDQHIAAKVVETAPSHLAVKQDDVDQHIENQK